MTKIQILILSICAFSSVLAAVDPAFITVCVHKDMQTINANSELKSVVESIGKLTDFNKQDITVDSVAYKIKEITLVAKYGRQDNINVEIGNKFEASKLEITYNLKESIINLEFIIKLDGQEGTFSSTLFNKPTEFVTKFGKDQEAYAIEFTKISLQFNLLGSNCKVGETSLSPANCKSFFDKFAENNLSKFNDASQAALEAGVKANSPYDKPNADTKVVSKEDSNVSILFNMKATTNPILIRNDQDGEAIFYRLNGNVAINTGADTQFTALTTTTPDFDNFLISNGKYQYSVKQEVINKAYSLIRPKKENSFPNVTDLSIGTLSRVFPELTRSYARSDTFELTQITTDFKSDGKRPVFTGTLKIKFPKIQNNSPVVVELSYEYIPDIVSLSAFKSEGADALNLDVININSYVRYLVVSDNSGITDEFELRKWLTPVLSEIYDQSENKSPFAEDTKVETLFEKYKNLETYYNGAYIFSMKDDAAVQSEVKKELLFLGQ